MISGIKECIVKNKILNADFVKSHSQKEGTIMGKDGLSKDVNIKKKKNKSRS